MTSLKFGMVKSFHKDQIIFKEGQSSYTCYLIKAGEVKIYKMVENEKTILNTLGVGEIFGEMGLLNNSPRSAYAVASKYCDLIVIDKKTLNEALSKSPLIVQTITKFLMKRLIHISTMSIGKKEGNLNGTKFFGIIRMLILLSEVYKEKSDGKEKVIPYQMLVDNSVNIIGVHPGEVINIVEQLELYNLIEIEGSQKNTDVSECFISILNPDNFLEKSKKMYQSIADRI